MRGFYSDYFRGERGDPFPWVLGLSLEIKMGKSIMFSSKSPQIPKIRVQNLLLHL